MRLFVLFGLILIKAGQLAAQDSLSGFKIFIHQDGKKIELIQGKKNEITLKAAPFNIEVQMKKMLAMSVFAGISDTFYKTADTSEFPTCMMLGGIGVAEEDFNKDQSLWVGKAYDDGCNYWYYESKAAHRYNQIQYAENDSLVAIREVRVFSVAGQKKAMKISQWKGDLYLVFFNMDTEKCAYTENFGTPQRLYLKLNFASH